MSQEDENQHWPANERDQGLPKRQSAGSRPLHRPIIKIFIVYENDLNRDRAQFMGEELTRRLGQSFAFTSSWWSLESLENPENQKMAAGPLAEADIICFSLLSGGELPKNFTTWVEKRLFGRKIPKLCLLALVETGGTIVPRLSRAEVYLSHLSEAVGVDCLCYSDSIPLPRSIRRKQQEREPTKSARPTKGSPFGGAPSNHELSTNALSYFVPTLINGLSRLGKSATLAKRYHIGTRYFVRNNLAPTCEVACLCFSCTGIHDPNPGVNTLKGTCELTWFF